MNKIDKNIYKGFEPIPLDMHGWNGDSSFFGFLIDELKPKNIVEVGSWKGQSSITMAKKCKLINLSTTIYCIDTWLGATEFWCSMKNSAERSLMQKHGYPQVYYQFLSNVIHSSVTDYILPLPMPSSIGWRYCRFHKIEPEMIYIDASHEKGDVIADITNYWPLLKTGGVMFGDDFHRSWPGVVHDVNLFGSRNKIKINKNKNFWYIRKE